MLTPKAFPFVKRPEDTRSLQDIDFLLKMLFEKELQLVRVLSPLRATIQDAKGYAPHDLFRLIDTGKRNSFSYQEYRMPY